MQVGQFSPVVATTVVLLFTFVCGVIGTPPLNKHLGVAELPPHSESPRSQPTSLVSRLKLLTDKIAVIYDQYSCALEAFGEKDTRVYLCPPDVTYTFRAGFNPLPPAQPLSRNPSNRVGLTSGFSGARNIHSKKPTPWSCNTKLPVELRTRVFHQPHVDPVKTRVMTPLPEGFPGRELTENDLRGQTLNIPTLTFSLQVTIGQAQVNPKSTPMNPDKEIAFEILFGKVLRASARHSEFLNKKAWNRMVGIQATNGIGFNGMMSQKLVKAESILLIYCNKNDPNTYYELIWEPNDLKYSAEILMAYFTRFYHFVTFTSFTPRWGSKKSEDIIKDVLQCPEANICSHGSSGNGKAIFYTLQSL